MVDKISEEQARQRLHEDASKVTEDDVGRVLDKSEAIQEKFKRQGPLERFWHDAKLMLSLLKDYWSGRYRDIPWYVIAAIVAALFYVFSPIDLIPDLIPIVGLLDDAAVVSACLLLVEQQLVEYERWKLSHGETGAL